MNAISFAAALARMCCAAVCVVASAASAQPALPGGANIVVDDNEPASRCLVFPERPLEYPADGFKDSGTIRVRLTFVGGEERPRVEAFYANNESFRSLVLDHVGGYRMPCLEPGRTVVLTQEFLFHPTSTQRIIASEPRRDGRRNTVLSCVTGAERPPDYPHSSLRHITKARVLARAEFTASDAPPRVDILFNSGDERFERVVRTYMGNYRLPCLEAADFPIRLTQPFNFRMDGDPVTVLKDTSLSTFLRNVSGIERQHVRFDFATMGCPFDVAFALWRPYDRNVVREAGGSDPNRREFLEWLRTVDLDVPKKVHDEIVGDSMKISIPCGMVDLL